MTRGARIGLYVAGAGVSLIVGLAAMGSTYEYRPEGPLYRTVCWSEPRSMYVPTVPHPPPGVVQVCAWLR